MILNFATRVRPLVLGLFIITQSSFSAFALPTPVDQITGLLNTIEGSYGPMPHKESYLQWKWENYKADTIKKAKDIKNSQEFYQLAVQTLGGLKDAHVSAILPSSLVAKLPVQFVYVQNKVLLGFIGQSAISMGCLAEPGDELLSFNNQPLSELLKTRIANHSVGNQGADLALNTLGLSSLSESRGQFGFSNLKGQFAKVSFKSAKTGQTLDCALPWAIGGDGLISRPLQNKSNVQDFFNTEVKAYLSHHPKEQSLQSSSFLLNNKKFKKYEDLIEKINQFASLSATAVTHQYQSDVGLPIPGLNQDKGVKIPLGSPVAHYPLPADFKPIQMRWGLGMLLHDNLNAGTFTHNGKTVGYLRLGSYVPSQILLSIFGLRHIIGQLEAQTDYLIIDQTFNVGGYVIYSDFLVSSLTGDYDDSKHMRFAFKPSQKSLQSARLVKQTMDQTLAAAQDADKQWYLNNERLQKAIKASEEDFALLSDAYQKGLELSVPIRLYPLTVMLEEILSHDVGQTIIGKALDWLAKSPVSKPATYTHPVYFVINELDFSAGDATPAILQDYGRVKLIGSTTAGAGGSVGRFSLSMGEPLDFTLTESLMIRSNGQLVENFGVKPDIQFAVTAKDIEENYANYWSRLVEEINKDLLQTTK